MSAQDEKDDAAMGDGRGIAPAAWAVWDEERAGGSTFRLVARDRSGMFADVNFKLVIAEALLADDLDTVFARAYRTVVESPAVRAQQEAGEGVNPDGSIPELAEFLQNATFAPEDLAQVTEIVFDGGNQVYGDLRPDWDGEDERFDPASIVGVEHVPNLRRAVNIAMGEGVLAQLVAAGVVVEE